MTAGTQAGKGWDGASVRAVVFDPMPEGDAWFGPDAALLAAHGVDLIVPASEAEADAAIVDADVVVVTGIRRLDAQRVATLQRCVGIQCYSIGMDKVDGPTAEARGIPVRNVPDYCTEEVSDHALTLLLAAQRRLVPLATGDGAGPWPLQDRARLDAIRRLRGQTLGIVGAGRIGRLVARKARVFGFTTIAYDPYLSDAGDPDLVLVPLDDLLQRSDAIVLCAALTPGSPPVIADDSLALVRPGVIIVNVARGGHIDEAALAAALTDGRVAVAALDVRVKEPPDPATDVLGGLPNVIQTPHIAATSQQAIEDLHRLAAESVLRMLEQAGRLPSVAA